MANTVIIKRSGTSSESPTSLQSGEIAINYADGKLFYKNSSNSIVGAKLITNITGTNNQVSVSEASGTFTIGLPSSVYVNSLFVDNVEIDPSGATPGYALAYNGTKFVPTAISGGGAGAPSAYSQTIGNGSSTSFVLTHNLGTRDLVVVARNASSPYEVIEVNWQATSINTTTIIFSNPPSNNSIRITIYAAGGTAGVTSINGTDNQINVTQTTGTVTLTLSNNLILPGDLSVTGSVLFGIDKLNDVVITSATPEQFLKWNGTNWVNANIPQINALDDIGDVDISTAVSGQFLKYNGTNWINDSIPTINNLDDIGDVLAATPSLNQVLLYDGSNWIASNVQAATGSAYTQTIGDGLETSFAITHNLGTRDVFVAVREVGDNYENLNVAWEATSNSVVTVNFDSPPALNSTRVLVYSSLSSATGTTYSTTVGNGLDSEITVTHNLGTKDIIPVCRLNSAPYNDIQVSWEALTDNTLKLYFGSAPDSNSVKVNIFSTVSGSEVGQSILSLTDTNINTPGVGEVLAWDGSQWINDTIITTINSLDSILDVDITSATPDQFLKWDGSSWINADIPQINSLNDISDVQISGESSGELLKWNGSAWVNSDTVENLIVSGDLTVNGTTTTINTENLLVEDNVIVLNNGSTATPSFNAGIEVERGNFANVQIRWNETTDKWQFTNDGTTYKDLGSGGVTVSDTTPSSPAQGDMWYESDTGALFAYYDSYWIEIGGSSAYNEIIGTVQAKGDLLAGAASQSLVRLAAGSNGRRLAVNSSTTTGLEWVDDAQNSVVATRGDILVGATPNTLARLPVGSNGQILVSDSSQTYGIGWSNLNTRNLLYNGAMQVAQRTASSSGITTSGYYTADRWNTAISTAGTWTQSIENDGPTGSGFTKSLRMLCTTADSSPTSSDLAIILQKLEGQDLQGLAKGTASAQQVTVSFWVKSNVTGIYIADIYDATNNRGVSRSYTISSSGVWEQKVVTFPGDTVGTLNNNNAESLSFRWWLVAGSSYQSGSLQTSWATSSASVAVGQTNAASSINNYWQITGVQLNVGPVAAPFDFKSYETELRECQRYYEKSYPQGVNPGTATTDNFVLAMPGGAQASSSGIHDGYFSFKVEKRGNAQVTIYDLLGNINKCRRTAVGVANYDNQNVQDIQSFTNGCYFRSPSGSAATNTVSIHYTANSEI